ncbi:Calcineurin-like phosphoesterase domain-containing protein [Entamoeba marina]
MNDTPTPFDSHRTREIIPSTICVISDTHEKHRQLEIPPCDILICCGDFTNQLIKSKAEDFLYWLRDQPASNIVFVPGNHDRSMFIQPDIKRWKNSIIPQAHYLDDETIEINGIRIYGCGYPVKQHIRKGVLIGLEQPIDIFISHEPPFGTLDYHPHHDESDIHHVGSRTLSSVIETIQPKLHCFGHIHDCFGLKKKGGVLYMNASVSRRRDVVTLEGLPLLTFTSKGVEPQQKK